MKRAFLIKRLNDLRASYWFIPSIMTLGAMILSIAAMVIDGIVGARWIDGIGWLYANRPEGARELLSTIAGSMITVAGVTFSITIAAVSYASAQFGPRILTNFMQDRGNQITLGTFIATFMYCLLVLRTVRSPEEAAMGIREPADAVSGFVPHLAILIGLLLTLASVGVFIYFIHHIPDSIHLPNVVAHIGRTLHRQMAALYPERIGLSEEEIEDGKEKHKALTDQFLEEAVPVRAEGTGYLQAIDGDGLTQIAQRHDLLLRVEYRPGDFISHGKMLVLAWPATHLNEAVRQAVLQTFAWGRQRTPAQNILFPVDELVEIAARALSPGVNDPFTANNCMDWLGSALSLLSTRRIPDPYRYDEAGRLRVITFPVSFEIFAAAIFDQLRPYVQKDRNASFHMMRVIAKVAIDLEHTDQKKAILHHASALKDGALPHLTQEEDRKEMEGRYRVLVQLLHDRSSRQILADRHGWLSGSG